MAYPDFNMEHQWLPFTPNRSFAQNPRVFVAADGMHFTTHDGRQVLDGIASLWCVVAGHNRRPINEAIKRQLDTLDYATAFQASNDQAFKAAEMIAAMAPGDLNKVLFCNSGSEAADTSLKVALAYHRARGEGHRHVFIGREKGYHGVNFGGMSVGGLPANRKAYGAQLLPRVDHMRFIHDPVGHAFIHGREPVWDEDPLLELEQRIYDAMMQAHGSSPEHAIELFHGYTYSGHPVACAAAIACLSLYQQEALFERAGQMGRLLGDAVHSQIKGLPHVVGIRTLGLAAAVELAPAALPGKRAFDVFMSCFAKGVLVRPAGENLVLCPPYIVEPAHIEQMVSVLAQVLREHA